jgi:hypothetical protein
MSERASRDEFMSIDYKRVLAEETPEATADCEWLLATAGRLVEREAQRRGLTEWQLFQRRHEIESPRVHRAFDVLEAAEAIAPDPTT